jgi:hypothetical protein
MWYFESKIIGNRRTMIDKRFLNRDSFAITKKDKTKLNFDENKFKTKNIYFVRDNRLCKPDFGIAFGRGGILLKIP